MDLSINKIKKTQQNNLSFQGVSGGYDINNVPVVRFNPPPYNPNTQKVSLEFAFLEKDDKTYNLIPPEKNSIFTQEFNGSEPLIMPAEECSKYGKAIAYRYKIESKYKDEEGKDCIKTEYILDSFEKINIAGQQEDENKEMNVLEAGTVYEISPKSGPMYHVFIDSNAILTTDKQGKMALAPQNTEFVRNHFNKLNGSLKGLNFLLKNTNELDPYTYIISNPTIGADKISSAGYWPENLYQCEDEELFKDFNFELFKRGKSYVADGAFTSQGLQSPLVQHALKWGEQSPWYNMLKIDGKPSIGIYPRKRESDDNPYEHIGVRIVNNPDKKNYDSLKPTYFQFYDDRMSSKEQREDSTKLIEAYDSSPKDHYEISTYDDSVHPFYFELDLYDKNTRKKLSEFKDKNAVLLKDLKQGADNFLTFDNFSIVSRDDASGAVFWDGNRDLVKFNLSNPNNYDKAKIQGMKDAREYLCQVPAYWTEMIQSDLILKTAEMSAAEKRDVAIQNKISCEDYDDIIQEEKSGESIHPVLIQNKTTKEYVEEFPLQSIKTAPELSAVFAQPQFKKLFLSNGAEDKIISIVNSAINNIIPEKYKNNSEYRTYVVKTCANGIIKNILVGAMDKNAINQDGTIDVQKLENVNLKSLGATNCVDVREERRRVASKLAGEISQKSVSSLEESLKEELKNVSLEDFKLAESIIIQGKAGLNWRFDAAKDIVDLDAVRSENKNFADLFWEGDYSFITLWNKFTSNIRKYNPSDYVITELTDAWSFYDDGNEEIKKRFDKYCKNPDQKERDLILDTRATTTSNYSKYFNKLSIFAGVNPENHSDLGGLGSVKELKKNVSGFLNSAQPNTGINSHSFFDNHDKPRVLHTLPLDMEIFLADTKETYKDLDTLDESKKEEIRRVLGNDFDFSEISSKAIAVALILDKQIEKMGYPSETENKLKVALSQLAKGQKNENSAPNRRRSEAFGNQDYKISIKDMFEKAGIEDKNIKEKMGEKAADTVDEEVLEFNGRLLKMPMQRLLSLWQVTNAIPGTPTLFNGNEFAQTGYEERCKNITVKNREQICHELKNHPKYEAYYKKMQAITSLYKDPQLSALRGGTPTVLEVSNEVKVHGVDDGKMNYFIKQINEKGGKDVLDEFLKTDYQEHEGIIKETFDIDEKKENRDAFIKYANEGKFDEYYTLNDDDPNETLPIYSYDEKGSQTISVISKNGVSRERANQSNVEIDNNFRVKDVKLLDDKARCPLSEGTVLKKKKYDSNKGKYVDDGIKYIIKNNSIVREDGQPIIFDDTVSTFYVPKQDAKNYYWYNGAH